MKRSNNTASNLRQIKRQTGVYTLVIATILISASALAIRGVTRSTVIETRITANEVKIKEASHAAEAALDYAISWYMENEPTWVGDPDDLSVPEEFNLTGMPTIDAATGDTYAGGAVFRRIPIDPTVPETELANGYVLIMASATAISDSSVTASVRQYVHDNLLLADPDFDSPPLVLDGCISDITGTPDIEAGTGVAIETSQDNDGTGCIDLGHLDIHGGSIVDESPFGAGHEPVTLWSTIFNGIDRTQMEEISIYEEDVLGYSILDPRRTVIWKDDPGNYNAADVPGKVLGSEENPIILIFSSLADCPKANGGLKVYGVVFFDSPCENANGWGGLKVVGTVAIQGNLSQGNANSLIQNWADFGGDDPYNLKTPWIARVPGSWRDF